MAYMCKAVAGVCPLPRKTADIKTHTVSVTIEREDTQGQLERGRVDLGLKVYRLQLRTAQSENGWREKR
jgi:hypothetical protein